MGTWVLGGEKNWLNLGKNVKISLQKPLNIYNIQKPEPRIPQPNVTKPGNAKIRAKNPKMKTMAKSG